jgi:hydrogenase maturation protease
VTETGTLILGVGNELLSDEGAGIHALHLMQRHCGDVENLQFVDGGTLSFTLAGWIDAARNLIVFDAANLQQAPGSVAVYVDAEMDRFLAGGRRSAHEVGLLDLLDIARLTGSLPRRRALVGIQPEAFGWGSRPGRAVQSALPQAVDAAVRLVDTWGREVCGEDDSVRSQSDGVNHVRQQPA